jgi:hypothetical protein
VTYISIVRERHVNWGISISTLITSALYIIISVISIIVGVVIYYGTVLFADLQFLLGSVIGIIYTLRNCKPNQPPLKFAMIVGILGGVFSSVFISIYQTVLLTFSGQGGIIVFFLYLGFTLLSGAVIGLLAGAIIGTIYIYRDMKEDNVKEEHLDDDFFKDLIDK